MASSNHPLAQISTRLSIRWLPEPPFETTDTIVLTIGEWYVDLRVTKDTGLIDWAIAGQCLQQPGSPCIYSPSQLMIDQSDSNRSIGLHPHDRLK